MHGRVVREFSIDRVLDEVETLKRDFNIDGLWVVDDTFVLKEKRVVEFCEGLKKRKINIKWACQARVDTFTDGMAKAMKSSGCVQVDFGVESGSRAILDYIKKEIDPEDIKRAFRIAKKNGLRVLATVMVGVPIEREEDLELTEKLLDEIGPNFVAPFFITPFPGTELYDTAKANGWLDTSHEINWQSTEEPVMNLDIPKKNIKTAYERILSRDHSVFFEYLKEPLFLYDMAGVFIKYPGYFFKMMVHFFRGEKKDMMNLFLYIFRREMLG
jgi:radical SAM superfamily enzyme YgiQ (UPF0313 family)